MGSQGTFRRLNNALPSSMRYGQFRYYWMVLLAQVTGHQMLLNFTMGWLMYDLTGEELDLGFLGMAIALPALVLNLVGGVLADRLEPKRMVTLAQATSASVVALLAFLVLTDRVEVWHVLGTAVVIGAVSAIDQPSRSSIFPRLVLREHILNAVAMENIVWNAVRIGAPAVAGLVIENWGIHTSMFCTAAAFYLMSVVVSLLNLRERPPAQGRVVQQVREGFRYVRQHTVFSLVMLLTFCNSLFGMSYIHLMPSFADEAFHVGAARVGYLLGVAGAGALMGTILIANLKPHHPKGLVIVGAAVSYGIWLILFSLTAWRGDYLLAMGTLFFVGASYSTYLVGGMSTLQQLVPDRLRGRVMGLFGATWSLVPLGMAMGGTIAQFTDAATAVTIGAVIILVVALGVLLLSPEMRGLRGYVPGLTAERTERPPGRAVDPARPTR